ncbi:MAG: helix-turn-helix domain-containing protein [Pseudomonadota bacterium]|nr:helix-turn-helix domain-containing protein [Pseudomonadota bacterium]
MRAYDFKKSGLWYDWGGAVSGRPLPLVIRWRAAICAEESPLNATERLVAFALAQFADADGGSCYPAVQTVAKAAALKERATQEALRRLDGMGYVQRIPTKTGGHAWRGYEYNLKMPEAPAPRAGTQIEGAAPVAGPSLQAPATGASKLRHFTAEAPAPRADDFRRALPSQKQQEKAIAPSDERSAPETVLLPLKDGSEFAVSGELLRAIAPHWKTSDALAELNNARAWCIANPSRRKTRRGALEFARAWLQRAMNSPLGATRSRPLGHLAQDITDSQKYLEAGVEVAQS